jgi:hypothetical protein
MIIIMIKVNKINKNYLFLWSMFKYKGLLYV